MPLFLFTHLFSSGWEGKENPWIVCRVGEYQPTVWSLSSKSACCSTRHGRAEVEAFSESSKCKAKSEGVTAICRRSPSIMDFLLQTVHSVIDIFVSPIQRARGLLLGESWVGKRRGCAWRRAIFVFKPFSRNYCTVNLFVSRSCWRDQVGISCH